MPKRKYIIYETRKQEEMGCRVEGLVVDKRPSIVEGERWTVDRYSHGQGGEDTRC